MYDALVRGDDLSQSYDADAISSFTTLLHEVHALEDNTVPVIASDTTHGEVWMNTTQACNFSCRGCCTLSDLLPNVTMGRELMVEYLHAVVASAHERNYTSLTLKWAGGEPLLAKSFRLIQHAQKEIALLQKQYPSIAISQTLLSNGAIMNPEHIRFIADHGMYVAISMWGVGEANDRIRNPQRETHTFDAIRNNICQLRNAGVEMNISTVIGPDNPGEFARTVRFLWDPEDPEYVFKKMSSPQLPLGLAINIFRPQHLKQRLAFPKQIPQIVSDVREGIAEMVRLMRDGHAIAPPHMWDYMDLFQAYAYTCGSRRNYIALGQQGIVSCHEFVGARKSDTITRMRAGENVFDIAAAPESAQPFRIDSVDMPKQFMHLLTHGGAGCPNDRERSNDIQKPSSVLQIYGAVYLEVLSLLVEHQM
jgi:hypothetical protein